MIIDKIYTLPNGEELRYPIVIVESEDETRVPSVTSSGKVIMRHRRNYYTQEQYDYRCSTLVSESTCNRRGLAHPCCYGIPYIYFSIGGEGDPLSFIGEPSTELEKQRSRISHQNNRSRRLSIMRAYNHEHASEIREYHQGHYKQYYQSNKERFHEYFKKRNSTLWTNGVEIVPWSTLLGRKFNVHSAQQAGWYKLES